MIDDLIDLILSTELAPGALMPRLTRPPLRGSPSERMNSLAFARAFARRSARVFGRSDDGGRELVRESRRGCACSRANR